MNWCWLALVTAASEGVAANATAGDGMWLAAWNARRQPPVPQAARADARIVDPHGAPAWVSFDRAAPRVKLAFDDLAVQQARRQVLAGPPSAPGHDPPDGRFPFRGRALTAWRDGGVHEDPFSRIFPARCLQVGEGLLGNVAAPSGPVIERYGSASPRPQNRF